MAVALAMVSLGTVAAQACTNSASVTCLPALDGQSKTLTMAEGDLHLIQTADPISTVLIGKKGIVSPNVLNDRQLSLTVSGPGATRVVILGEKGAVLGGFQVLVTDGQGDGDDVATLEKPDANGTAASNLVQIRIRRGIKSTVTSCHRDGICEGE